MMESRPDRGPSRIYRADATRAYHPSRVGIRVVKDREHRRRVRVCPNHISRHGHLSTRRQTTLTRVRRSYALAVAAWVAIRRPTQAVFERTRQRTRILRGCFTGRERGYRPHTWSPSRLMPHRRARRTRAAVIPRCCGVPLPPGFRFRGERPTRVTRYGSGVAVRSLARVS